MIHPDQHYEIARLQHQEFVAQAQHDHLAARCAKSMHGMPARRVLALIMLLHQAGTWVTRAVQRRLAGGQPLSAGQQ